MRRRTSSPLFSSTCFSVSVMSETKIIELPDLAPMRAEVGNGIAAFSSVESGLSMLYGAIMHPAPRMLCYLTLDEARHIETKCRIIKAVGTRSISEEQLPAFRNIMKRVQHKAATRHKVAHWQVSHWHKNQPVSSAKEMAEMQPRLFPAYYSAKNIDFSPDETMTMSDLKDFTSGCLKLKTDIVNFTINLRLAEHSGD